MAPKMLTVVQYLAAVGFLVLVFNVPPSTSNQQAPRNCSRRWFKNYRAEKPGCRPQRITIVACSGRCQSSEIPMLLSPYKRSNHSMCSYNEIEEREISLEDCDPGVDPAFTYLNAVSCICRRCDPYNTYCQGI